MNPTFHISPYPVSASATFQQQGYSLRNTFDQFGTTNMDSDLDVALPHPVRKKSVFDQPDDLRKFALLSSNSSGTGSLTEFTKRKNWSQRIVDEIKDFLHVLSPSGKIMYSAPSSLELLGFSPEELVGRHITEFIHVDDIDMFIREFQMAIHTRRDFKLYYRFRKKDDKFIIFEVTGHPYFTENSAVAKCFFAMAQPYPTKATSMLDSFLELKIENERLRRKLREVRSSRHSEKNEKSGSPPVASQSSAPNAVPIPITTTNFYDIIDGEDIPTDISETTPYVDELKSSISYPIINQTVPETIELFTGLHYKDGERASGISTGLMDATLSQGVTISGPLNENDGKNDDPLTVVGSGSNMATLSLQEEAKKDPKTPRKKKPKMEDDEYVCTDCGTTESPEWRKGPNGPKTLCNACGLRWSKKNKKNTGGGEMGENMDVNP